MFIYFGEQCDPIKYYITIRIYNIPLEMVRDPRGGSTGGSPSSSPTWSTERVLASQGHTEESCMEKTGEGKWKNIFTKVGFIFFF